MGREGPACWCGRYLVEYGFAGQSVDVRAGRAVIAVAVQVIGPRRIQRNENDILSFSPLGFSTAA